MPRIAPLERDQARGAVRDAFDQGLAKYGRMTNMKRTLLHSLPSYHALMEWYPLFDVIASFLDQRSAIVFAHAISSESDCLICTTFMRRILIEWGEDPNAPQLDERDQVLVAFGRAVARHGHRVSDELYGALTRLFTTEQIVALTAFASIMMATNLVNNVLEVELDEYLYEYRDGQPLPQDPVKHDA